MPGQSSTVEILWTETGSTVSVIQGSGVCCEKLLLNCDIGHAAICVKNNVYEYGKGGVKVHMNAVEHYRKDYKAKSVGTQGTGKFFGEFCDWVQDTGKLGYTQDSYHWRDNNCYHFVRDACSVLAIDFPQELQEFLNKLERLNFGKTPNRDGASIN